MYSSEIAEKLEWLCKLMELHQENPFKIKSLQSAAFRLDKMNKDLSGLSREELENIEGIGKSIASKIEELQSSGKLMELDAFLEKTPEGVQQIMRIKGLGPKKVQLLWKELNIESPGELWYACNENRLLSLKGFGEKTQQQVKAQIEFMQRSAGQILWADAEAEWVEYSEKIKEQYPGVDFELGGSFIRKEEIIDRYFLLFRGSPFEFKGPYPSSGLHVEVKFSEDRNWELFLFINSCTEEHLKDLETYVNQISSYKGDINKIYQLAGVDYLPPELRDNNIIKLNDFKIKTEELVKDEDIKGVMHTHTVWSDGANTIEEMAGYCISKGYQWLGLSDHSQSAFYANGLKPERLLEQWSEVDKINSKLDNFRIFKGIESDILSDGSLDYTDDILKEFDFVIASVHSVLRMDEEKATTRLIKAIENKYTSILGHLSGRLLLTRAGYPLNMEKVLDACASNGVIIELNANPHRLDIDRRFIWAAMEKGIQISINPDAHTLSGIDDIRYGIISARKGLLKSNFCFNRFSAEEVSRYFFNKKSK